MPDEQMSKEMENVRQAKQPVEVVVSSKALEVAKGWVRSMAGGADSDSEGEDSSATKFETRPLRLGLGAKYLPHSKLAATINPVERKLRAMTSAGRHQPSREARHQGAERIGNQRPPTARASNKGSKCESDARASNEGSKCESESANEDEEVKGSSVAPYARQQKRIGPDDLITSTSGPRGRGAKRKR